MQSKRSRLIILSLFMVVVVGLLWAATATKQLSLTVSPATLVITTDSLPGGMVGVSYSAQLTASGGIPPYTWGVTGGALPAGLSLSTGGLLSGTPSEYGTFNFTVTVTDGGGAAQQLGVRGETARRPPR